MKILDEIKREKEKREADQKKLKDLLEKQRAEEIRLQALNFKDKKEIESL